MNSLQNNIQKNLSPGTANLGTANRGTSRSLAYVQPQDINDFLDEHFPLMMGSHKDAQSYGICYQHLIIHLSNGTSTGLRTPGDLAEVIGRRAEPEAIVLSNNYLSAEIDLHHSGAIKRIQIQDFQLTS